MLINTFLYECRYCHPILPFPVFGGGIAVWDGNIYIVGGADGFGLTAVDRVMVVSLNALTDAQPCKFSDSSSRDWWSDYDTGTSAGTYPAAKTFLEDVLT